MDKARKRLTGLFSLAGLVASLCLCAPLVYAAYPGMLSTESKNFSETPDRKEDFLRKKGVNDVKGSPVAPVYRVQTDAHLIALTFDDGPHPVYTEKILALLKEKKVKATFFLNGAQVRKHPGLVKQIVKQGHEVGNHGYLHRDLTKLSPVEIYQDLHQSHRLIERVSGQKVAYFRPMGGKLNQAVLECARQLGLQVVLWSVDPKDWDVSNPADNMEKTMMDETASGDIILLHDGGAHQEVMIRALSNVIERLQKKGFQFVTVSELLSESKTEQKVDEPLHIPKPNIT